MNELYPKQKQRFKEAYATGTDKWSNNTYVQEGISFLQRLPHNTTVLDIGSGRGNWAYTMADLGMKVIGLDYIPELIERNNADVKLRGYAGRVAFMAGDVFNIPLQDKTIDIVTDFNTLQHIHPNDWNLYTQEVLRVLKPGGFILLVQLSKMTETFINFEPRASKTGNFEIHGFHYHFFTKEEFQDMFGEHCSIVRSEVHTFPHMDNHRYIFTLLQKKA